VEDNAPAKNPDSSERGSRLRRWQTVAMNAWIAAVILVFFALRVLDSNTVRRILHSLAAR
jgi:hypothetical protein